MYTKNIQELLITQVDPMSEEMLEKEETFYVVFLMPNQNVNQNTSSRQVLKCSPLIVMYCIITMYSIQNTKKLVSINVLTVSFMYDFVTD